MLRSPRNSWPLTLGFLVLLLGTIAPTTFGGEPWEKADRDAVQSLSQKVLARLDQVEAAQTRMAKAETAAIVARAALDEAECASNLAEIEIREYSEGTFPQDLQTAEGEIKLNESELARTSQTLLEAEQKAKAMAITPGVLLTARIERQKAEIGLQNAKIKREVLLKYSKEKETQRLEAKAKKAKSDASIKLIRVKATTEALATAQRNETNSKITPAESKATALLSEIIDLFDSGKAEPARAKLADAQTAWEKAQSERAEARFKLMKLRLKMAAESVQPAN